MRSAQEPSKWSSFEWAVTGLLAICAALLVLGVALIWSYLPDSSIPINGSTATKHSAETELALSALKEQQTLTNSKLDAIKDELHALNEKAARAANVTPPSQTTPEAAGAPRDSHRLSR
jgi:cell division septal protein FtsQ